MYIAHFWNARFLANFDFATNHFTFLKTFLVIFSKVHSLSTIMNKDIYNIHYEMHEMVLTSLAILSLAAFESLIPGRSTRVAPLLHTSQLGILMDTFLTIGQN